MSADMDDLKAQLYEFVPRLTGECRPCTFIGVLAGGIARDSGTGSRSSSSSSGGGGGGGSSSGSSSSSGGGGSSSSGSSSSSSSSSR